ncbi:MAG: hypothetical protein COB02_17830 [Candidatus Cloacimonadota bacterium]|nr:MAG: hypothetical protein COB02_17830 [Candidatus Cloacimonadota bacterium]
MKDLHCLILLGGKSSRFVDELGFSKANYKVFDKTWLTWQLEFISRLKIENVSLVLGYNYQDILDLHPFLSINQCISFKKLKVYTYLNQFPEQGSFSSLQLAIKKIDSNNILYFPIDVPVLDKKTLENIIISNSNYKVVKCCYQGKGGHPILIKGSFLDVIKKADIKKSQLNTLIRNLDKNSVLRLNISDSNVLLNLNYPKDLKNYISQNIAKFISKKL